MMKNDDRYEKIIWALNAYGHLVPLNRSLSGPQLAAEIRRTYVADKRNETAAVAADSADGVFSRFAGVLTYTESGGH